jgi:hypothetical protein
MSAARATAAEPRRRASVNGLLCALLACLLALGCTTASRPGAVRPQDPLPTPYTSWPPVVIDVAGRLASALAATGLGLEAPVAAYRPSEPRSLVTTPRAVLRATLADPTDGHVIVYDLPDEAAARAAAQDLADYLGSGFGQTNFPPDAQFSVAVAGDTVVFTWWSRAAASDPAASEAAFTALATVGEGVEVRK